MAVKEASRLKKISHLGKPLPYESWSRQASKKERKTPKIRGHFDPHPVARKAAIACSLLLIIAF
jgi:hypothetical protein